jgi:hypothetical protein
VRIVRFRASNGKQLLKFLTLPLTNFFRLERGFSGWSLSEILVDPAIIARETSFSEPLAGIAHDG